MSKLAKDGSKIKVTTHIDKGLVQVLESIPSIGYLPFGRILELAFLLLVDRVARETTERGEEVNEDRLISGLCSIYDEEYADMFERFWELGIIRRLTIRFKEE